MERKAAANIGTMRFQLSVGFLELPGACKVARSIFSAPYRMFFNSKAAKTQKSISWQKLNGLCNSVVTEGVSVRSQ